ncbi:uncharacterized protein LOC135197870 isoform X1 [Macrobrachium nipponense]|uniref:uncharacterized protein LOC135197870 isoform X1 n=1 Tax=Macrobrachium nipponense TaxID=159736 RepID=UPI0030C818EC
MQTSGECLSGKADTASKTVAGGAGNPNLPGEASTTRKATPSVPTMEDEGVLVTNSRSPVRANSLVGRSEERLAVVGGRRQSDSGCPPSTILPRPLAVLGCVTRRLGSPYGGVDGVSKMELQGQRTSYKRAGVESSFPGSTRIQGESKGTLSGIDVRQHHSSSLYKQARRPSFSAVTCDDSSTSPVGYREPGRHQGQVYSGKKKHSGRQVEPQGSDSGNGVVPTPTGSGQDAHVVGRTDHRPIRNQVQQKVGSVLFSSPGRRGSSRRCATTPLGQSGRVRISSILSNPSGSEQGNAVSEPKDDPGSPVMAESRVVSRPTGTPSRCAKRVTSMEQPSVSASRGEVPPVGEVPIASRVETVKYLLRERGFSQKAATQMAGNIRKSSATVYQGKWSAYCDWCRRGNVSPLGTTIQQLADFLIYLRTEKHMSVSAVKGYRAALASVLRMKGVDISSS